ncbi:hypothetical protein AQUCO_02400061v1 [Aquilegia coerulea]|uniref:Transposase Tnp1/En/Spm-like domain-containing protein n=1 Tax=Aquilegia coerulea TaxID=218851 RepID=A0A2G5DB29_AQUCA|nr:hypothetical protein AQUCO_02400061v1 [Aquilegia coerulea]
MASPTSQPSGSTLPSSQPPNVPESVQPDTPSSTTPSEATNNTQKLLVEVTKDGIVYGDNANAWKKRVSYYFRASIPISYASWSGVDVSFKDKLWEALMKEFYFSVPDYKARPYVEKGFAQKLRTRKVKYRPLLKATLEESIAACPTEEMDPLHWRGFCINKHTEKQKEIKKKNAASRKRWKTTHCLGRRSYAQNKQNPGKKARRVDAWKRGRNVLMGVFLKVLVRHTNKEVVASGVVDAENGGICHGREVDDGEVKVYVEKVFDGSTPIYDGPQNSCTTLEDIADGGYLIWLKARLRFER